jgi:hypothetical protein
MLGSVNYNADDVTFNERKMMQSISKLTTFRKSDIFIALFITEWWAAKVK